MTSPPAPSATTLKILDRQLVLLEELAQIGMVVTRAQAHAAAAAAHAVEVILADELWQPETGRALALAGSKHAADAYQGVVRSLRLTLLLEKATTLTADAVRAGTFVSPNVAGLILDLDRPLAVAAGPAATGDDAPVAAGEPGAERGEFERAERLPAAGFRVTVNGLCEEIGADADWANWSIHRRPLEYQPLAPKPPGSETRPPPDYRPGRSPIPSPRHGALAP